MALGTESRVERDGLIRSGISLNRMPALVYGFRRIVVLYELEEGIIEHASPATLELAPWPLARCRALPSQPSQQTEIPSRRQPLYRACTTYGSRAPSITHIPHFSMTMRPLILNDPILVMLHELQREPLSLPVKRCKSETLSPSTISHPAPKGNNEGERADLRSKRMVLDVGCSYRTCTK